MGPTFGVVTPATSGVVTSSHAPVVTTAVTASRDTTMVYSGGSPRLSHLHQPAAMSGFGYATGVSGGVNIYLGLGSRIMSDWVYITLILQGDHCLVFLCRIDLRWPLLHG